MTQSSAAAQAAEHSLASVWAAPVAYWQTFLSLPINMALGCAEAVQTACVEGVAAAWLRPGMPRAGAQDV